MIIVPCEYRIKLLGYELLLSVISCNNTYCHIGHIIRGNEKLKQINLVTLKVSVFFQTFSIKLSKLMGVQITIIKTPNTTSTVFSLLYNYLVLIIIAIEYTRKHYLYVAMNLLLFVNIKCL